MKCVVSYVELRHIKLWGDGDLMHYTTTTHYFSRNKRDDELKSQLAKIGASSENGSHQMAVLSRNVKLLMAASDKTPQYKVHRSQHSRPSPAPATCDTPPVAKKRKLSVCVFTRIAVNCIAVIFLFSIAVTVFFYIFFQFSDELDEFLAGIDLEKLDLDKVQFKGNFS